MKNIQVVKKGGGIFCRQGLKFNAEIEKIKDARLRLGLDKYRMSTEKITNLIVRNKYWKELAQDIVNASEEEVEQYGI